MSARQWGDYHRAAERVVTTFGKGRPVEDLRPEDFGRLRAKASQHFSAVTLARFITLTRFHFAAFAFSAELIDRPVRHSDQSSNPARRVFRPAREKRGPMLVSAEDRRGRCAVEGDDSDRPHSARRTIPRSPVPPSQSGRDGSTASGRKQASRDGHRYGPRPSRPWPKWRRYDRLQPIRFMPATCSLPDSVGPGFGSLIRVRSHEGACAIRYPNSSASS